MLVITLVIRFYFWFIGTILLDEPQPNNVVMSEGWLGFGSPNRHGISVTCFFKVVNYPDIIVN